MAAKIPKFPTKHIATTPAMMRCEGITLASVNKNLLKCDYGIYFNNFDEFKDMIDNTDDYRSSIMLDIDNAFYEYAKETVSDKQFEELISELNIKQEGTFKDAEDRRYQLSLRAASALIDQLIRPPSSKQLKMMQLEM